jgi:peptide/nickel transport system permease protein
MTTMQRSTPRTEQPVRRPTARRHELLHLLGTAARTPRGAIGLVLTLLVVAVAILGPLLSPHSPTEFVGRPFGARSPVSLLGEDNLGRDVLSRTLNGGWQLLVIAAIATAIGVGLGLVAGIAAAYLSGWRDSLIMRTVDVVLAFPQLVFALLCVSVVGPSTTLVVIAVGVSHAPQVARVIRATALDVSERDFVKTVQITGVKPARVMRREILPNLTSPLMVEIGLRMTYSIVIIAGLSFVGFGLQPPAPNWGTMINENRIGVTLNTFATIAPAFLLAAFCVGLNNFTDAIARAALGTGRADTVALTEATGTLEVGNVA